MNDGPGSTDKLALDVSTLKVVADRHESQLARLDDAVADLRVSMERVATRDDVDALRRDVTQTFAQAARDAQNSTPAKVTAWFTGAMLIVSVVAILVTLAVHISHV